MGYDNVATTSPTNDKGIDVIGTIKLGISAVREVIQVKRHRGTIHRPVLDQLRGSLHRFNAVRGTIITTGRFSKGVEEAAFERGAAPITLIDGEKLLDLLIDNGIGVSKRPLEYLEFAPEKLARFEGEARRRGIAQLLRQFGLDGLPAFGPSWYAANSLRAPSSIGRATAF